MPADGVTTSLRCAPHWCWLRADHMLTVASSPLLSLSLSLSASQPLPPRSLNCSQSPPSLSSTFSACPSRPSGLPLSAHFLNVICMHPPAVCLYPLPSQPLNRREPSRSQPHVLSLSLLVSFLNVVCALPEQCLRTS